MEVPRGGENMPLRFFRFSINPGEKKNFSTTEMETGSKKQIWIIYAAIVLAVWTVFWQVREFDFVQLDDNTYVTANAHLRQGLSWEGVRWAFGATDCEFWHPLTWLTLLLDFELFGLQAGGYHLTNVLWHLLATLLLFSLFFRMTGALWKSAFVAAFFALHPLHVESVAWVSERKDVLSAFFWMLTLYGYVRYTEKPSLKTYLPVVVAFLAALMSKPMVVTLPLILMLLDVWPLKRWSLKKEALLLQLKEKLPLLMLSGVFSVITVFAQQGRGPRDLSFPLGLRLANALVSFVLYLKKTFWPFDLAAFYPFPDHLPALQVVAAALLMVLITVAVIASVRRRSFLFVGWFWFGLTLSPVLGIIPIGDFAMADRFHYLPSIGLAIILAWGAPQLIKQDALGKKFLFAAGAIFLLGLAAVSYKQTAVWKNDINLFQHMLRVTKNNYLAYINLGTVLEKDDKIPEALTCYHEAIRIMPNLVLGYHKRALAYAKLGRHADALEQFNQIISLKPDYADAYLGRGSLYFQLGRYSEAMEDSSAVIRLRPDDYAGYFNRANALIRLGEFSKALEDLNQAAARNAHDPSVYNNRGFIHLQAGRLRQALEDFTQAVRLNPHDAGARNNRAFVLLSLGDAAGGCAEANQACTLGECATLKTAQQKGLCR